MKKIFTLAFVLTILSCSLVPLSLKANFGENGVHDPSSIIKLNGVYHVWATGDGIRHLTSTDLVNWSAAPSVFPAGTFPSWIYLYVSNFGGNFWAPECIYMNGKYYLYYSVSMGQRPSAIGVTTSTDLVNWTDQGMVVYSDNATNYGSIDPAVYADANHNYWMVFGSHLWGIWTAQIDSTTGKRLNNTLTNIAGTTNSEHEAAYVIYEAPYYYLFYNVGTCCALLNSTYNVKMGRSTSPTGPFADKNGTALLNGGGTQSMNTSGRYIGPGHYGLFKENNLNIITMHYYDGTSNGYPRLDIAYMKFGADGWPVVSRDLLKDGRYRITNKNSNLAWQTAGCTGLGGQQLIQNTPDTANICQKWDLTSVGDGFYRLKNANAGPNTQVVDVPFCNTNNKLATWDWLDNDCQKFKIERHANGSYLFSPATNTSVVIEVPFAEKTPNTQLGLFAYNECTCQQWAIDTITSSLVLPLNMLSLSVTLNATPYPTAKITWSTDNETGVNKFEVERSINGTDFIAIGSVAANNVSGTHTYAYYDQNPAEGYSYYRIKEIDKDGAFVNSKVLRLANLGKMALSVFPNPATSQVLIRHPQANANALIQIKTVDGKNVASINPSRGSVSTATNIAGLKAGLYLVVFSNGMQTVSGKLIKQ